MAINRVTVAGRAFVAGELLFPGAPEALRINSIAREQIPQNPTNPNITRQFIIGRDSAGAFLFSCDPVSNKRVVIEEDG